MQNVMKALTRWVGAATGQALKRGSISISRSNSFSSLPERGRAADANPAGAEHKASPAGGARKPGWIAYWEPSKDWARYRLAAERFNDKESSYNATLQDILAGQELFAHSRGADTSWHFPWDEVQALQDEERVRPQSEPPSDAILARRNAVFKQILTYVDPEQAWHRKVLDKDSKALVPHQAGPASPSLKLKDGGSVSVRPTDHGDPQALAEFLGAMSDRSFQLRFPHAEGRREDVAKRLAVQLVHSAQAPNLDKRQHSLVVQDDKRRIVGFVDYQREDPGRLEQADGVALDRDLATCEVNFAVSDEVQGQGLGSQLFDMARQAARKNGFRQMLATVHKDNRAMLALLAKAGITKGIDRERTAPGHSTYVINLLTPEERQKHDGARADQLQEAQIRLVRAGVGDRIRCNGKLDAETREALKQYQKNNGLPVTGLLTEETLKALGVPSAPKSV
jgi:GNAT superfamily N-acetyltransferase